MKPEPQKSIETTDTAAFKPSGIKPEEQEGRLAIKIMPL